MTILSLYLCEPAAIVLPAVPLPPYSYSHPRPPLSLHAQRPTSSSRMLFSLIPGSTVDVVCCTQRRTHESAKKASLQIRFVIVGGGAAGLACAVALRRVGHHVIVLEKGPNFIGVRTTPVPFNLAR